MKNRGISLIVLIITIVVIIILATAIIVNLAQTNIIANANVAVVKQDFKIMQDELDLYIADKYADTLGEFNASMLNANKTTTPSVYEILTSLEKSKYKDYVTILNGKIVISDDMPEPQKTWAMEVVNSKINDQDIADNVPPTTPTNLELTSIQNDILAVASGATDNSNSVIYEYSLDKLSWQEDGKFNDLEAEEKYVVYARAKDNVGNVSEEISSQIFVRYGIVSDSNKTINGSVSSYSNPIIPVGFRAIQTKTASWRDDDKDGNPDGWNNGLVIADVNENQFVWVPVDGTNVKYEKNFNYPSNYNANSLNTSDNAASLPSVNGTTIDEMEQITNYGGFYIGRYEAGVSSGTLIVQKGATVWTGISSANAIINSKKNYESSTSVRSGIVRGKAWDAVCSWISEEKDSQGNILHSISDSKSWGNYSDTIGNAQYGLDGITKISGTKQTSGYSEYWKAKNIYDLAGNVWEWSGECSTVADRVYRGGGRTASGGSYPASYRATDSSTEHDNIAFRIMLYII